MYLTQFTINPARRAARNLLDSPHRIHGAVMKSFADLSSYRPGEHGRILWRLDTDTPNPSLYIVSPFQPDLTHLVEHVGWPTTATWRTVDYGLLLNRLREGQRWGFRLTANPVRFAEEKPPQVDSHKRQGDDATSGERKRFKRVGIVAVNHQAAWLRGRAEGMGVTLTEGDQDTFLVTRTQTRSFSRVSPHGVSAQGATTDPSPPEKRRKSMSQVTIRETQFDGTLTIRDPDSLRDAMVRGIGPAKGYGCGLLTLAPL